MTAAQTLADIDFVAIKQDGRIYQLQRPNRHHDVIHMMIHCCDVKRPVTGEQGFMVGDLFATRTAARAHVMRSGQIKKTVHPTLLFSEDLW